MGFGTPVFVDDKEVDECTPALRLRNALGDEADEAPVLAHRIPLTAEHWVRVVRSTYYIVNACDQDGALGDGLVIHGGVSRENGRARGYALGWHSCQKGQQDSPIEK